jgi:hypothetical protein
VESLEHFHQNRSVIEDFTSRTLSVIPSDFGRLYYVSSLRDSETGQYLHAGLMDVYSANSVQAALAHCHEELFTRILEASLKEQESDLRKCMRSAGDEFWSIVEDWRASRGYQTMCPQGLPDYLNTLFCSNVGTLLEVFAANRVN